MACGRDRFLEETERCVEVDRNNLARARDRFKTIGV